jgi:CBS domain-containing protein
MSENRRKQFLRIEEKLSIWDKFATLWKKMSLRLDMINHLCVVSERDFVRKITAEDKQSSKIPLSEIMSFKFRWVDPTTEIEEAVQKMLNHNIRRLLVLENEKLVGVITQTDLASFLRSKLLIEGTVKNIGKDTS